MLVVDDEEIAFLHVPECLLVVLVVTNTCVVDIVIQLGQFLDHLNLVCSAVNEASKLVDLVTSTHHEINYANLFVDVHQLVVFVDARVGNDEAIEVF